MKIVAVGSYLLAFVIFIAVLLAIAFVPMGDLAQAVIAAPGAGAMFAALFQLVRDAQAHERRKELHTDSQIFELGATSHMSHVAFDKHVEFCEAYMIEVHETIGMLFRYGPTSEAIARSRNFWELHRKYAAWMPKSISLKLDPFETAINEIGVKTHLVEAWGSEQPEQRSNALSESYAVFANVMSLGEISGISPERKREIAVENVKEEIRNILGINELFEIRNFIVKRSIAYVETRT